MCSERGGPEEEGAGHEPRKWAWLLAPTCCPASPGLTLGASGGLHPPSPVKWGRNSPPCRAVGDTQEDLAKRPLSIQGAVCVEDPLCALPCASPRGQAHGPASAWSLRLGPARAGFLASKGQLWALHTGQLPLQPAPRPTRQAPAGLMPTGQGPRALSSPAPPSLICPGVTPGAAAQVGASGLHTRPLDLGVLV